MPPSGEKGDKGNDAWQELNATEGIGEVVAEAVVEFFKEPRNLEALDALLKEIDVAADGSREAATRRSPARPWCSPARWKR